MSLNGKFGVINGQIILLMVTPGRWSCTYETQVVTHGYV